MADQINKTEVNQKHALSAVNMVLPEGLAPQVDLSLLNVESFGGDEPDATQKAAWLFHPMADTALQQGLALPASAHLLALGETSDGHADLVFHRVRQWSQQQSNDALTDLIAVDAFNPTQALVLISLPAGLGYQLQLAVDQWLRRFQMKAIQTLSHRVETDELADIQKTFSDGLEALKQSFNKEMQSDDLNAHFARLSSEFESFLSAWQPSGQAEGDPVLESLLTDSVLGRFRINVLISHQQKAESKPPVIVDSDPSLSSLFGGLDAASEQSQLPLFLRLRAGSLLRANGGVLLLHLRDLLADEQCGPQLLEKLCRFCRNGHLTLDDVAGGQLVSMPAQQDLQVKIMLLASHDYYYAAMEDHAELFSYFPVKLEFCEQVKATVENYQLLVNYILAKSVEQTGLSFSPQALRQLLKALHRLLEDQTRLSTNFQWLDQLLDESVAIAKSLEATQVSQSHVQAVLSQRNQRHNYVERQLREAVVDQDLMINVTGEAVGQVNGLTHIDLAEASFGSPIRVSANCYPGRQGVVTIDREVALSGPSHDKGVLIMQSWLQQHFAQFAPLNFTASLVFEQEYAGVDGDSASCAELFALMSALTQLPVNQSIAVTGGMNQHGEVIPVGGLNDKVEGYFNVCKAVGLNGTQGVLIPAKNARNLVLSDEVIAAVSAGHFKIATMSRVEEGFMYLMDTFMEDINRLAAERLKWFKSMIETNKPSAK